ncbi:hypothetical protein AWB69_03398 [Caballeronia udeis]|jgi:cation diffusion facilitator CzcD-associated flavoprotein CzcO|uniref:Uncharacterized protein n=1 Tax=Caballeronia udeis TaxID=1232866 RepID=A0A158GV24_9BURK|nr:hypothetical protein [Caballeronia udeis]SAL35945.1 hypothetical protein AWB69_03398 [Caballeronia udeis]
MKRQPAMVIIGAGQSGARAARALRDNGRDGNDTTDRWAEGLLMRDWIRELWNGLTPQDTFAPLALSR